MEIETRLEIAADAIEPIAQAVFLSRLHRPGWIERPAIQQGREQAPRYLIRDRDGAYGEVLIRRLRSIGIRDRPTSRRAPLGKMDMLKG
jgi:hypothetical protein